MATNNRLRKANHRGREHQGPVFGPLESRMFLAATPTGNLELFGPAAGGQASPDGHGLTPTIVRQAYGINQVAFGSVVGDGAGQTIAIIDAYDDPTIRADLHTFDQQFSLADLIDPNSGKSGPTLKIRFIRLKHSWY